MLAQTDSDNPITNYRFLPTEGPRQVVEEIDTHPTKLAGEIGFNPVATMQVDDKNFYVRPVRNTNLRAISPGVVGATGKISIQGERVIDLGQDLHAQIRAKVNNAVSDLTNTADSNGSQKYVTSADVALEAVKDLYSLVARNPATVQNGKPEQKSSADTEADSRTKSELEKINKMLFEQIKQKVATEIAKQQSRPDQNPSLEEVKNTGIKFKETPVLNPLSDIKLSFTKPEVPTTKEVPTAWTKTSPTKTVDTTRNVQPAAALPEPNSEELKTHITKLEDEIKILIKEVENLDNSIRSQDSGKSNKNLATIERQIQIDQKMLSAVADWRLALNNLINSHTVALKYLKQKTDWLEQNLNHRERHEKMHSRPKEPVFDQKLIASETVNKNEIELRDQLQKETPPPYVTAVRDLVKLALKMEGQLKEANPQANPEVVKDIVKDTLQEESLQKVNETPPPAPQTVNPPVIEKAKVLVSDTPIEPTQNKQDVNAAKDQPAIAATQPTIVLTTADVEKQILAQAEKEEDVKAAIRKAKEEAAKTIAAEKAQAETLGTKSPEKTNSKIEVSEEILKSEFDKLKSSLTTLDDSALKNLPQQQRAEMIHKLENLEKQSVISKQYDEIKALAERRRINQELSSMLHRLGEKVPEPGATAQITQQKIETLKTEGKKKSTPAEKARLIAEIKDLERQTQAKKAVSLSRPAVKAQPAFGKMLPNTPTIPNVINGIVKDNKGLLLSTVVIIVTDNNGDPVRAFKTNKIGQFALSTPVPNGIYRLELEKQGYDFDIIEVNASGAILPPIEIRAK